MAYSTLQAKEFIEYIAPIVQAEAKKRGYKICSTTIAQAIIEGACGTSSLAKNYANHFGLKCGSSWKGDSVNMKTKEEYTTGTLTTIKDNFRAYLTDGKPDDAKGIAGYYDFISSKRYQGAFSTPLKDCSTYKEFAEALKKCGYATSSSYVNTLCSTVVKWDLTRFDNVASANITNYPDLFFGQHNEYVRNWQLYLSLQGYYNADIDGIFGKKTEQALKEYQKSKGLPVDGKVSLDDWKSVGK